MNQIRPDELYHYGRKGMKWGQHIFGRTKDSIVGRKQRKREADEAEAAAKRKKKISAGKVKPRDMTEEELKQEIARLDMEKKYVDLMRDVKAKQHTSRGRKFVDKTVDSTLDKLADNVTADLIAQLVKHYGAKGINKTLKEEGVFTNNKKK